MDDESCLLVNKYTNLLKVRTEIGTEFMQELRAQEWVFRLVRVFGIYRTLSLISITGETARLTLEEAKEI